MFLNTITSMLLSVSMIIFRAWIEISHFNLPYYTYVINAILKYT